MNKLKIFIKKILLFQTIFSFLIIYTLYAGKIKISEDIKIPFNKDFNNDGKIIITLDAGHGGKENGTTRRRYFFDDKDIIKEKDLNLTIVKNIKKYIEENSEIEVYLTRSGDEHLTLTERGNFAGNVKSDLMISVHFNSIAKFENNASIMGCEIWQSVIDMYKPIGLPKMIFEELNKNHFLQITRGVRERISGDSYWNYETNNSQSENNGNPADYYGVIKAGAKNKVPTIILENCFFSNDYDFSLVQDENFLNELSIRVGKAVVRYYDEWYLEEIVG